MEKPNYYGILPANVRYDKRLKPMEKILYTEITTLANIQGYCYAGNSYFGNLYEVDKKTVGVWVNNLIKLGYLNVEIIYKENSKEVLERRLYIVALNEVASSTSVEETSTPINKNMDTPPHNFMGTPTIKSLIPPPQKNGYPPHKKMEDNTTRTNITSNNTTRDNTTTKLDNINKIEQEKASTKSSSSFVLEKSLEERREEVSNRDRIISKIVCTLLEFGVSEQTIKNIIKLDITLERVEKILKFAKDKNWGEGAIYKALKENWEIEEKKENILSDEELESKKKWLRYFAGLDSGTRSEVLEMIKPISLEKLEKNKKRLARTESIFEFKQEIRRLGK